MPLVRLPRTTTLICQWLPCKKAFTVQVSRTRDMGRQFCSPSCSAKYRKSLQDTGTLADRFWPKVLKGGPDDCWPWQASKGSTGYGMIWVLEQDRLVGAHVVSWFLHTGEWPTPDQNVLHDCPNGDLPACVNFSHLWLGTRTDNGKDMVAKERHANQFQQVSKAVREEIVALYLTGAWTYDQLGRQYGLSSQSIYTYVRNHRKRMHTQ